MGGHQANCSETKVEDFYMTERLLPYTNLMTRSVSDS